MHVFLSGALAGYLGGDFGYPEISMRKGLTLSGDFNRKWISGGWIVPLLSSFSQKELCYQWI
ncbi:hypothetical protein QNH26_20125 [Peribacillus frigoritolerans]|uniref:hypothetical protein n=1 Tax=Peribacillus frigoritolerans TaxID=450367 RepID=UPI0024C1A0CE|nr:hypothetical protein [Peribacillus frigoritolerans]WHX65959.1 hypothetical protein QNH26_20125 [Peribacillus frigoritolerans]